MNDFLSKIRSVKENEVTLLKKKQDENAFAKLFESASRPVFIAEIKPRSPSEGVLYEGDPIALARVYADAGADAVSVLTDETFFGGSMDLLQRVRRTVNVPLLRKDFIIDRAQLVESVNRCEAVLLIVRMLDEAKIRELIATAYDLALVPVVEVASSDEMRTAVAAGAKIIGVNARDLRKPSDVNLSRAYKVLKEIPSSVAGLLFSGVQEPRDVADAVSAGAKSVLVGTSILKEGKSAEKVAQKIKSLKAYDK
jgi:indole-3-glycerol phosphate synthase